RGKPDLFGRTLEVTVVGFGDEIAAAAGLVMGQADEGQPVVLVRGLRWAAPALPASELIRPPGDELLIVANTGDDFEHLGLSISPDLDTLMYTLADVANPETGWGRRDETWSFMAALEEI